MSTHALHVHAYIPAVQSSDTAECDSERSSFECTGGGARARRIQTYSEIGGARVEAAAAVGGGFGRERDVDSLQNQITITARSKRVLALSVAGV